MRSITLPVCLSQPAQTPAPWSHVTSAKQRSEPNSELFGGEREILLGSPFLVLFLVFLNNNAKYYQSNGIYCFSALTSSADTLFSYGARLQ